MLFPTWERLHNMVIWGPEQLIDLHIARYSFSRYFNVCFWRVPKSGGQPHTTHPQFPGCTRTSGSWFSLLPAVRLEKWFSFFSRSPKNGGIPFYPIAASRAQFGACTFRKKSCVKPHMTAILGGLAPQNRGVLFGLILN